MADSPAATLGECHVGRRTDRKRKVKQHGTFLLLPTHHRAYRMAPAPICVAVIGYGSSARTFHIPFLLSLPDLFHLHTIQQRPGSKSGPPASESHPNVRIAPTLEAVFEGNDGDGRGALPPRSLVIVTTSNDTHNKFALQAMKAGHHVVVEKPAALTVAEAESLLAASQEHGLVCSAYQNRRLDSDFLTLRALLSPPRNDPSQPSPIGQPTLVESRFDRYRPFSKGGWREEVPPEKGGGMLWDLGAHLIDQGTCVCETVRPKVSSRLTPHAHPQHWSCLALRKR